jgi:hypothetical protein
MGQKKTLCSIREGRRRTGDHPPLPNKERRTPGWSFLGYNDLYVQTLAAKGYSTDFLYGYDWHWRAEETFIGRGNCSAAKWPQAVKRLHGGLSSSLFTMLPSRFALAGGVCAREHVRKFLDSSPTAQ